MKIECPIVIPAFWVSEFSQGIKIEIKMYKNGQNKPKLCKILVLMALNTVTLDVPIEYPGMPIVKTRVSKDYSPSM